MAKSPKIEKSMHDIREDAKLAGKAGMSPRKFEGTKADKAHDRGQMNRGGMARKGSRGC